MRASAVGRLFSLRRNAAAVSQASDLLKRHGALLYAMSQRELMDRFAGSGLGAVWAVMAPILVIVANIFAYAFIFRIRLNATDTGLSYAAFVLAAMVPWSAISDTLGRATPCVVNSSNLVKQIVFPCEIIPLKIVAASIPTLGVGLTLVIALNAASGNGSIFGALFLGPAAITIFLVMTSGLAFALSAIGVFVRDVKEVVGVFLSIGIFLHPIFYPPESTPAWLLAVFHASPLSYVLWCFRDAFFYGRITDPVAWIVAIALSVLFFVMGWRLFRGLRPSFGNLL